MKQFLFIFAALLAAALPLGAEPSIQFSTVPGSGFAWQLRRVESNWLLVFPVNSSQIDSSNPVDASLFTDFVNLPEMAITNLQDQGEFFTATLAPTGPLTIVSDTGEGTVLTASMASAGSLFVGTNYVAFSAITDDLDVISHVPAYSPAIDSLVAGDAGGLPVDLSFSGDAAGGVDLVSALRNGDATGGFTGTSLSGQITIVPAPGALLLAGIGTLAAGYVRWRLMS